MQVLQAVQVSVPPAELLEVLGSPALHEQQLPRVWYNNNISKQIEVHLADTSLISCS